MIEVECLSVHNIDVYKISAKYLSGSILPHNTFLKVSGLVTCRKPETGVTLDRFEMDHL